MSLNAPVNWNCGASSCFTGMLGFEMSELSGFSPPCGATVPLYWLAPVSRGMNGPAFVANWLRRLVDWSGLPYAGIVASYRVKPGSRPVHSRGRFGRGCAGGVGTPPPPPPDGA